MSNQEEIEDGLSDEEEDLSSDYDEDEQEDEFRTGRHAQ